MKKKLFPFVLSALMLIPNTGVAQTQFKDVTNHWATTEIQAICQKGYLKGLTVDQFSPNTQVTRAELAASLDRVFDFNYDTMRFIKPPVPQDFYDDVQENQWYSEVALKCGLNGIIVVENRKFNPNQPVTRLEMAKAIQQAFQAKNLGVITTLMWPTFSDTTNLAQEDQNAVSFIYNTGIMKGKTAQQFSPNDPITRAELAVILNRTLGTLQNAFPQNAENTSVNQQEIDLRGKITDITTDEKQETTKLFVEGQREADTVYDKAYVTITPETTILKGNAKVYLQELKKGSEVEVVFAGPVLKSYPAQGAAKTIKILE